MNKKIILSIALFMMLASCKNNKPSIYDGLDNDLVSFVDSIFAEEPNCEIQSITRDSSAYYDVSMFNFVDTETGEKTDFFDLVDEADSHLHALALESYPDIASLSPVREQIYKITGIDHEYKTSGDVFVVYDYDGWKLMKELEYIPEAKFKAYLEVLRKKLDLN